MERLGQFFVEGCFWILIWLSPALLFSALALVVYVRDEAMSWLVIALLIVGAIAGALLAERIRRRHGCSNYMSRLLGP